MPPISMPADLAEAAVTAFRAELAAILAREAGSAVARDVVVLALDGVGYEVARECWPSARTRLRRSVWPTTTATSWLSQLTGCDVATHGIPGVVFRGPAGDGLINVFDHQGRDLIDPLPTVFDDAAHLGYTPMAVLGDMETYPGRWRDALLHGAQPVLGHRFYTPVSGPYRERAPELLASLIRKAVADGLSRGSGAPRLLWCYIEVDRHVHHHGYDSHTTAVLAALDRLACELADTGAVVLAHADHGLVATRPDPELAALLDVVCAKHDCLMGGAGRTRWLYPAAGTADAVAEQLRTQLPASVSLDHADARFGTAETSRARRRVGELVLTALGESFLVDPDYRYEHGSLLAGEVDTPLSSWGL
ncbi:alkaline phosphatase family protein [Dactylosporangium sp. NPDC051484]|uniref:alkaline phosphatase family protein n=1 Tax=Dactylosporangium sp. NPDC051484 TaxID=3154942 RepID=UPI0034504787